MHNEDERNEFRPLTGEDRDDGRETSDFEYFSKIDGKGDSQIERDLFFNKLVAIKHDGRFFADSVKKYRAESLSLLKRVMSYEISRLEYKLGIERYRYSADPNAGEKHEREIKHRILGVRLDAFRAMRYERRDQRRYEKAMSLDAHANVRRGCRGDVVDKCKAQLILLLEKRAGIELELSRLYEEKYKEYVGAFKDKKHLKIKLRAARKAYKRYRELSRSVSKYIFSPDDKAKLFDYVNKTIELSSELAVAKCKYRSARGFDDERAELKRDIAELKRERARNERSIGSLLAKARRRTYLYGEGGIIKWAVGFAVAIAVIIAAFCLFYEPIMSLMT